MTPTAGITPTDIHLFNEGTHRSLYEKLGAHLTGSGTRFAVWAPNAASVSVIGDFNGWDSEANPLEPVQSSGIWEGTVGKVGEGETYKYHVVSRHNGYHVDKADPFAFTAEVPPATGSRVASLDYTWDDAAWMESRESRNSLRAPMSVYEIHAGSWRRVHEDGFRSLSYSEITEPLIEHVQRHGFTHVEFLPVMEHPFFGSWGYQTTGYFAPSSRYGSPAEFMALVDRLHQEGIGVILDWVPSHFPTDEHGLGFFDGTHLYEHEDPRQGLHKDWDSLIFNYGRNEVRSFLISSAMYWLDKFHIDGIRVDAVASMLYLDYSREPGEWIPNQHGGRENLEALDFLRDLNIAVYDRFPGVQTIAEESTAWPMVSRPTYLGGLGFGMKWDMGWMHDTLQYFARDPIYRRHHHAELTFRSVYAFSENFMMPLSHDEVVYGKGSMLQKMPGDAWQKMANLRLLYAYMYAQPGKKLLFMGSEFGQAGEWNHDAELDWNAADQPFNAGLSRALYDLNRLYRDEPALHELDCDPAGFQWVEANDADNSTMAFLRHSDSGAPSVLAVFNFTPVPRGNHRIGVPEAGRWLEIFNSDAAEYGGSGQGNMGHVDSVPVPHHDHYHSLTMQLPPLGALFFRRQ
ncbi:MAG: 1,4-alpha-glucan branching protein GlgB [Dehalococcoidia bacterium]|nr:1,4-alpha-glucan branching protein GlgB [Dehalococcoidia bacterium]